MKRLFAAIKIHPSGRFTSLLNEISSSLHYERIKWVEPENMHLTLKFFGETDEKQIPAIGLAMKIAAQQVMPFVLTIANTGIFGSRYDPKVIWFGINAQPSLNQLAIALFAELQKCGWQPERQNFVPHLTIGRIREINDKPLFQKIIGRYNTLEIQEEPVTEIVLYESILRREGPLYVEMLTVKL